MAKTCIHCGTFHSDGHCLASPNGCHVMEEALDQVNPWDCCLECGLLLPSEVLNGTILHHCDPERVAAYQAWLTNLEDNTQWDYRQLATTERDQKIAQTDCPTPQIASIIAQIEFHQRNSPVTHVTTYGFNDKKDAVLIRNTDGTAQGYLYVSYCQVHKIAWDYRDFGFCPVCDPEGATRSRVR